MKEYFLSASVPDPRRNRKYFETADIIAIRDAVRALVTVILPHGRLVWGGHPAITPMISIVAKSLEVDGRDRLTLYQSAFFPFHGSPDMQFENIKFVPGANDRVGALRRLREVMISSHQFEAGIFVGGMEGVEAEYRKFKKIHGGKPTHLIASTGGAALKLYNKEGMSDERLVSDFAYPTLFRDLLGLDRGSKGK